MAYSWCAVAAAAGKLEYQSLDPDYLVESWQDWLLHQYHCPRVATDLDRVLFDKGSSPSAHNCSGG